MKKSSLFKKPQVRARHLVRKTNDWLINNLKYHIVESTAILAASTPIFAAAETSFVGMTDDVSINTRILAANLTYFAGFGRVFSEGRKISRKIFKVTEKTNEWFQGLHDALYTMAFAAASSPPIYYIAGEADTHKIAIGTILGMGIGLAGGWPVGYSIDVFEDLTGLRECNRRSYPDLIKRQNPYIKKGIVGLLTAASIALTAGIYSLTPDNQEEPAPRAQESALVSLTDNRTVKAYRKADNEEAKVDVDILMEIFPHSAQDYNSLSSKI